MKFIFHEDRDLSFVHQIIHQAPKTGSRASQKTYVEKKLVLCVTFLNIIFINETQLSGAWVVAQLVK